MTTEEKIKETIDNIRPYLVNDGGDIEYIKFEDNTVYVRLMGACSHCGLIDVTLKEGIENVLTNEIPEVKRVERID